MTRIILWQIGMHLRLTILTILTLESNVSNMVVDWLAAGINPNTSTIFVQSKVPEHAELHLLLSMSTPISWLERVPSFKDQQEKLKTKDLSTYGFFRLPVTSKRRHFDIQSWTCTRW